MFDYLKENRSTNCNDENEYDIPPFSEKVMETPRPPVIATQNVTDFNSTGLMIAALGLLPPMRPPSPWAL